MTLNDRIAQLVVLPFYGDAPNPRSEEYQKYVRWVRDLHIGGLSPGEPGSGRPGALLGALCDGHVSESHQRGSKLPLLVAGDFERGDSMRVVRRRCSRTPWRSLLRGIPNSAATRAR